jgi:hypothetical protein
MMRSKELPTKDAGKAIIQTYGWPAGKIDLVERSGTPWIWCPISRLLVIGSRARGTFACVSCRSRKLAMVDRALVDGMLRR